MASNPMESPLITKTGTYTHASGFGNAIANINVKQYGNVVSLQGYIASLPALSASLVQIGSIQGVSYPTETIRTICTIASYAYINGEQSYFTIGTKGEISITPRSSKSAGMALYVSVVYVVNDL